MFLNALRTNDAADPTGAIEDERFESELLQTVRTGEPADSRSDDKDIRHGLILNGDGGLRPHLSLILCGCSGDQFGEGFKGFGKRFELPAI